MLNFSSLIADENLQKFSGTFSQMTEYDRSKLKISIKAFSSSSFKTSPKKGAYMIDANKDGRISFDELVNYYL